MHKESRKHQRLAFQGTIFIELVSSGMGDNEPSEVALCKTIDISPDGLLVGLNRELTVGAILQIGIELSQESKTLYLTGEVKHCRRDDYSQGRWQVGFELLNATGSDIDAWREVLTKMKEWGV